MRIFCIYQAKIYDRSCALGPWIVLGTPESDAREWKIKIAIERGGQEVFAGEDFQLEKSNAASTSLRNFSSAARNFHTAQFC